MPKKCAPGVICIENVTLLFIIIIIAIIGFLMYQVYHPVPQKLDNVVMKQSRIIQDIQMPIMDDAGDTMNDPYAPPLKRNQYLQPTMGGDVRGLPINIKTRATGHDYQQIGILTKQGGNNENLILPLMGRRIMTGRDRWQYYTMSNTGFVNTKLPISVNGRSCSGEYGCDIMNNGDIVYVEGYNDTFNATIYENSTLNYIPYL
jgi:hypothetical protein